jgi:AcrR family transcriptional regulator
MTDLAQHDTRAALEGFRHGRVPREVRTRQLIHLGEQLFAERGFRGASMDELARRAGVTKPVIYELVGNKEALFRACMQRTADDLAERVLEAVSAAVGIRERLSAGALAWFQFVEAHRDLWDRLLSGEDSPMTVEIAAIRRRQARLVAELLAQNAAEAGVSAPAVLLDALAHLLNGAFESLALWWRDHSELSASFLAELFTQVVNPGLEALATMNLSWDPPGS